MTLTKWVKQINLSVEQTAKLVTAEHDLKRRDRYLSKKGYKTFTFVIPQHIPLLNKRLNVSRGRNTLSDDFRDFYRTAPIFVPKINIKLPKAPKELDIEWLLTCHPLTDNDAPRKAILDLVGDTLIGDDHWFRDGYVYRIFVGDYAKHGAYVHLRVPREYLST